ncbi:hypothetical protein PEBR_20676 [Penicillium brasilianum]|uniref:Uncharacterized protein n=1 Tax=Penicillium brasilianum TaxID=104259 RepID=A0A1S9RNQ3_PENBI|nr:hypothetical protein PEBR_20676 [Penicillium brasilianum]
MPTREHPTSLFFESFEQLTPRRPGDHSFGIPDAYSRRVDKVKALSYEPIFFIAQRDPICQKSLTNHPSSTRVQLPELISQTPTTLRHYNPMAFPTSHEHSADRVRALTTKPDVSPEPMELPEPANTKKL